MNQAKATKKDIRRVTDFFLMLEQAIEDSSYVPSGHIQPQRLTDARLCELITEAWGHGVDGSWRRVVMGVGILIDQCCDPDLDHLEWRPDVRKFLESQGLSQ